MDSLHVEIIDKKSIDTKDNKEEPSKLAKVLKLYVVPLAAFLFFVGLVFFLIIPKVGSLFNKLGEISNLTATLQSKQTELRDVRAANDNSEQIRSDLDILDSLAPTGRTEVVVFQTKISELVTQHNLTLKSQRLSDIKSEDQDLEATTVLALREIPNVFVIDGSKEDILRFIDALQALQDFIIIKELEFNVGVKEDLSLFVATLELNLVKYQFGHTDDAERLTESYLAVPINARPNPAVQEFIEGRRGN